MSIDIKKILFATDLSEYCSKSYEIALGFAMKLKASITLLHVMQDNPVSIETELRALLGDERYEKMMTDNEMSARSLLIGKRSQSEIIKSALYSICEDARNRHAEECIYPSDNIIIKKGTIAEEILSTAEEIDSDLIMLSLHKNLFAKGFVSGVIKTILKKSEVPVILIPPNGKKGSKGE